VDYMVAPFNLLTWSDGIRFLAIWNYWGHICLLTGLLLLIAMQRQTKHHHHHHHPQVKA